MPRAIHTLGLLSVLFMPAPLRAGDETELYTRVSKGCFETLVDGTTKPLTITPAIQEARFKRTPAP